MGRADLILLAFPQVTACARTKETYGQKFEKIPLAAPPAGFEPAHTAPEGNAPQRLYLAKRAEPVWLGGVWGVGDRGAGGWVSGQARKPGDAGEGPAGAGAGCLLCEPVCWRVSERVPAGDAR
jgi:hypothetical protein